MAMAQQLPAMQSRVLGELVVALLQSAVVTPVGIAALVLAPDPEWSPFLIGGLAAVDVLAALCLPGRVRLRGDLARVVADFGRTAESGAF